MQAYATLWWTAARHWAEIASYSPFVIGERLVAMSVAGPQPSAAHQAEMTRMVIEKGEAVAESATALWLAALHGQQLAWQKAWASGRAVPAPQDLQLAASTARKLGRALSPVSTRVAANARRLAAKKRRRR
jgi:hypothetical protein